MQMVFSDSRSSAVMRVKLAPQMGASASGCRAAISCGAPSAASFGSASSRYALSTSHSPRVCPSPGVFMVTTLRPSSVRRRSIQRRCARKPSSVS